MIVGVTLLPGTDAGGAAALAASGTAATFVAGAGAAAGAVVATAAGAAAGGASCLRGCALGQRRYLLIRRGSRARDGCGRERRLRDLVLLRAGERDRDAERRRVAGRQGHDARAVIGAVVITLVAVPPPARAPEGRAIVGPHRTHGEMKAAALDPRISPDGACAGGGRVDPGNAHARATEIEAVHVPAPAAGRIGRRAGGVDVALVAAIDLVGTVFRGAHLHALAVELAVERHGEALGGERRTACRQRQQEKTRTPR